MAQDGEQTSCRVTGPGEDQWLCTLPNMAMQTEIHGYGAHPLEHQAVIVLGPQPQRGPSAVGRIRKRREGYKQRACLVTRKHQLFRLSSHSGMLRDFERRNPSYRSSWKGREWTWSEFRKPTWHWVIGAHHFTLRGYKLFWHDRAHQYKGGIVTLVWNTILAVEVGRSEGDSEYLAIRVIVQGREITVISYYCPPDKDLQLQVTTT